MQPMKANATYQVVRGNIQHGGEIYTPGMTFDAPSEEMLELVGRQLVREIMPGSVLKEQGEPPERKHTGNLMEEAPIKNTVKKSAKKSKGNCNS